MRRFDALALALVVAAPSVLVGQSVEGARQGIRAMFDSLGAAAMRRDRAALERIYAPEFQFVHATGGIVSRAQLIDGLVSPAGRSAGPVTPALDSMRLYGDVAILSLAQNGMMATNVWVHRDGRWQIALVQGTMLPQKRPTIALDTRRLADYAGRYVLDTLAVVISVDGDSLMVQRAMGPRLAVR